MTEWNAVSKRLQTDVAEISYDVARRRGIVKMPDGCCTDMSGCIALFMAIDPECRSIITIAGGWPDTVYYRYGDGEWQAALMID